MMNNEGISKLQIDFITKKVGRLEIEIRSNKSGIFDKFGISKIYGQMKE